MSVENQTLHSDKLFLSLTSTTGSHLFFLVDLRFIYRDLATNGESIEINEEFSTKLVDRLEFGDERIRKIFEHFLRKYFVETSKNVNWIEFREILFPIITGRFSDRHLRRLFDLFDQNRCGTLTNDEIRGKKFEMKRETDIWMFLTFVELLELLQIENAAEFSSSLETPMSFDEFSAAIRTNPSIVESFLPAEFNNDDDDDEKTKHRNFVTLGRIFKRMGIDVDQKRLDSQKEFLTMKLTNEFIHQNVPIESFDLEKFIENFLSAKYRQGKENSRIVRLT